MYHHPLPQGSMLLPCFHTYSSLAPYFIVGGIPQPLPQIKVGIRVGVTLADELESGSGDTGQCYPIPWKKIKVGIRVQATLGDVPPPLKKSMLESGSDQHLVKWPSFPLKLNIGIRVGVTLGGIQAPPPQQNQSGSQGWSDITWYTTHPPPPPNSLLDSRSEWHWLMWGQGQHKWLPHWQLYHKPYVFLVNLHNLCEKDDKIFASKLRGNS